MSAYIVKIKEILAQKGPLVEEFGDIINTVEQLSTPEQIEEIRELMEPVYKSDTIIGHCYNKPLGYSGDYQIIEKIYKYHRNYDFIKWDEFFHCMPAAVAVINRKELAVRLLRNLNAKVKHSGAKVLILGSGPASEVNEYFQSVTQNNLVFDLVDFDQRAIEYAMAKNQKYLEYLTFHNKNVLRYSPDSSYDLIWSAGLFDYFQDNLFVRLLRRFSFYLKDEGEMIIGNFNVNNPSKKIMEILGDWYLYHRSKQQLIGFAKEAGIPDDKIEVFSEPLKINLFMRLKKPAETKLCQD
ncbi:MAG: class I SAM-dependent methyltransferase [Bacteroidales bacterium]